MKYTGLKEKNRLPAGGEPQNKIPRRAGAPGTVCFRYITRKRSEWKTNRGAVITGRVATSSFPSFFQYWTTWFERFPFPLRRGWGEGDSGGGYLKPSKKKVGEKLFCFCFLFVSSRPAIRALRFVFQPYLFYAIHVLKQNWSGCARHAYLKGPENTGVKLPLQKKHGMEERQQKTLLQVRSIRHRTWCRGSSPLEEATMTSSSHPHQGLRTPTTGPESSPLSSLPPLLLPYWACCAGHNALSQPSCASTPPCEY